MTAARAAGLPPVHPVDAGGTAAPAMAVLPPLAADGAASLAPHPAADLVAWAGLLAALGEPAWLVCASRGTVLAANAEAGRLLGQPASTLPGQPAELLLATPEDLAYWADLRAGGQALPLVSDTVLLDGAGLLRHVTRHIQPLPAAPARPGTPALPPLLVRLQDRSAQQREQQSRDLLVSELAATLESTADGILVTDLAGRISGFNRRFAQIWGLPETLLNQRQDAAIFDWMGRNVLDPARYQQALALVGQAGQPEVPEAITLRSGRVLERVSQPQLCAGRPCGRVWSFRDRTELATAARHIQALSTTDTLTGLANRRELAAGLDAAILQARGTAGHMALLLLDLDRFKLINDSLGQAGADQVLVDCADRLKAAMRQGDILARVGGDQFALLVHEADSHGAAATARRLLEAVSRPCSVQGLQFTLTCSLGVAVFPQDGSSAEALTRHAESAMHQAKHNGRSCFRFHQPQADDGQRQRMRLDHAMRQALIAQRFRLHYQPQINLRTGAVVGAEALIRWRDPELGEISPGQFIPVAEATGFIINIGDWVLEQAVRQAARWHRHGLVMPVAVNVSALQFQQADFNQRVLAVLQEHKLPPALLELELTESILVQDADVALARLAELSQAGLRLSIDDFGTGYSSLAYLKRFPINRLKIDRSFVAGVPADTSDGAIVRAVVQLAQALNMTVIAEGVETEAQRLFLRDLGCDEYQGFLFAPALDALSFEARVKGGSLRGPKPRLSLVVR